MTPSLRIDRPGVRTLVQDLGRPGHARLGVTASGAWDRAALTLGNRLLGNAEGAAGLEVLLGGLSLTALQPIMVALTGAEAPLLVDGRPAAQYAPVALPQGSRLDLGTPTRGLRCYLAVRGGLDGRRVFGSLSSDPTTGLGPAPLASGDELVVGSDVAGPLGDTDLASGRRGLDELVLRVALGPRDDWFTPEAIDVLDTATWEVSQTSDRVGTRLSGPTLTRVRHDELPSEGLIRGAVQVPADGQPLVFGPDHPTTGGYPVIACVIGTDADALAQAAPGTIVRFDLRPRPW